MGKKKKMPSGREDAKCPTIKQGGERCKQPAGYRTDHLGYGQCIYHGGNSPALKTHAKKERLEHEVKTMGLPREIPPEQALMEEVYRSAGVVAWVGEQVSGLQVQDVFHLTDMGTLPRAWVDVYRREREHLAKVAKMAIDAGIAERHVRIAEEQGRMLAAAIQKILGDLNLTPEQAAQAPKIVRRHLTALPA